MILSDMHLKVPRFCGCQTGSVYVRRCGRPAAFQCGQCGLDVCDEHAGRLEGRAGLVFCPACAASLDGREDVSSGQGGWLSRNSGGYYDDRDVPVFTNEDYAAFDALSDFDLKGGAGGHAYDS